MQSTHSQVGVPVGEPKDGDFVAYLAQIEKRQLAALPTRAAHTPPSLNGPHTPSTESQDDWTERAPLGAAEAERLRQQLAEAENDTLSKRETIERLKQDLKSLEEGTRRLSAGTPDQGQPGTRIKGFVGSGDRQYITGLKVGGQHILLLVDVSASMMDDSVVNVIRLRNMPESRRIAAAKWRRTVATVDWLTSQLPAKAKFQAYAFNTKVRALVAGSEGRWLAADDANALNDTLRELRRTVPQDGTSLENAFAAIGALSPRPDNIIIITDGLPTQGASAPATKRTIDGEGRLRLFQRALARLPNGVPVNVILLPMEGDPLAPAAYWTLARRTSGAFLSPARDWP
jgi:hypothetical protein